MFFHKYRYFVLAISYVLFYPFMLYLAFTFICSYIFYGMLNLFGHGNDGPINSCLLYTSDAADDL